MTAAERLGIPDARAAGPPAFDPERVRADFPALRQQVRGKPLVYLDGAATAPKPRCVVDAVVRMLERDSANVHRGVHLLSQRATTAFEEAREEARQFLGARAAAECVFVRGTTEGINLVASTLGRTRLAPGDEVLVTGLEHHSDIVPWQMACAATGARLAVAPVADDGDVPLPGIVDRIGPRTRIVALAHVSNTLGTVLPVKEVAAAARERGALVVVDGAQAAPHLPIDVVDLGVDFYAFSGHKAYGPTGIGVLWGRREVFETLPPWQGGGSMIENVAFERTTYRGLPARFEAGTPDIAGAVGLGAALAWFSRLDAAGLAAHEASLLAHAGEALGRIPGLRIVGTAPRKIGVVSFVIDGIHPHDLGTLLDGEGVAVRTGHHCTQPLMERFGVPATTRASFGPYTTHAEVEALAAAVQRACEVLG